MLSNILKFKAHLKNELISELAEAWLLNPKSAENAYEQGFFKYFFLRSVVNQVNSNKSRFYKNNIHLDNYTNMYDTLDNIGDEVNDDKEIKEIKYTQIESALKNIKISWFESQMFNEYYSKKCTYRELEDIYGISYSIIFKTVNDVKKKIRKYIETNNNNVI